MEKLILTDADGVLLDWDASFEQWMIGKGHKKPSSAPASYSLAITWGLPDWVIEHLVNEFNHSAHVVFIKPFGSSAHYVRRLADRGYRFVVCTAFGGDDASRSLRRINLHHQFGNVFDGIEIIELCGDKTPFLEQYKGSELWWIEDNLNNALKGRDAGLRSILLQHPHNSHYDGDDLVVAKDWQEIYTIITGEKEYAD